MINNSFKGDITSTTSSLQDTLQQKEQLTIELGEANNKNTALEQDIKLMLKDIDDLKQCKYNN